MIPVGVVNWQLCWELFLAYRAAVQCLGCGLFLGAISLTPGWRWVSPALPMACAWGLISKLGHFEPQNLTPTAGSTPLSLQGLNHRAQANETQSIPQLFPLMSLGMAEGDSGLSQPPACLEGSLSLC